MNPQSTHFIGVYSVACKDLGTGKVRQDYCTTEPREIRFLTPFAKSVGEEMVAVFYMVPKIDLEALSFNLNMKRVRNRMTISKKTNSTNQY